MKGLDLSSQYYSQIIRPLIESRFPEVAANHAAALIGWGSEVLGNDDEFSRDHEWGPRLTLFLPDSLLHCAAGLFNVLNSNAPPSFQGYPTRFIVDEKSKVRVPSDGSGDVHIEITTCSEYFRRNIGVVTPNSELEWLNLPEHKLLELTSGGVFFDGTGELTALREFYQAYYPVNVWKYRLAYAWQSLGWDISIIGLCNSRGDLLSARFCLSETIFRIIKLTFLLNRVYSHAYPKWLGKQFYKLPHLSERIGPVLESCHLEPDLEGVREKLEGVCSQLVDYQNSLEGLPQVSIGECQFSRGFWSMDLGGVAGQIHASVDGPLFEVELYGAIDQWVTNQDVMLGNQLACLSVVYSKEMGALQRIEYNN